MHPEPPIDHLYADPDNERAVHAAWESFLAGTPPQPGDALRTLIDTSWQRSLQAQVDPHGSRGPRPVGDDTLARLRENQRELLEASAPVMALARDFLAETGTFMALADSHSTILSFEGDRRTLRRADDIRLIPGVNWSERDCGTNAIGTALAVGQPVQIHSAEHFVEGIKRWTCSATVVRHPLDGEIMGVLDVSGLSESYSRQSLALVVTTASRIESRLAMAETERRYRLLDHAMNRWLAAGHDGAVLFDRRGVPIKINENAHLAIADVGGDPAWLNARRMRALAARSDRRPGQHAGLPDWMQPDWLRPLVAGGEVLGTLLVVPASRRVARLITPAGEPTSRPMAATRACTDGFDTLVYRHASMQQVVAQARQFMSANTSVLLHGETGTGKEAFARGLHGTRKGAFVTVNCGGLARELLASELFGYVEGAFTGARRGGMVGKIEAAQGGTLFLDEIGEMPLDMQPMLLRVLEEGEIYRLGDSAPRKVAFRLVAASHRNLRDEVAAGRFRMDLYYRIAVASLHVPPLRERGDDVLLLTGHYLRQFRQEAGQPLDSHLADDVAACLRAYAWPGNVRELRNVIEAAVLVSRGGPLTVGLLPQELHTPVAVQTPTPTPTPTPPAGPSAMSLQEGEALLIQRAIRLAHGNLTLAARELHIAKSTLYAKMKRYGLTRDGAQQPGGDQSGQ